MTSVSRITERLVLGLLTAGLLTISALDAVLADYVGGFHFPGSEAVFAVAFVSAGLMIVRTHPRHVVGRLFLWAGFLGSVGQLLGQLGRSTSLVLFASWGIAIVSIGRFPTGKWVSPWCKRFAFAILIAFAVQFVLWGIAALLFPASAQQDPPGWVSLPLNVASLAGIGFGISAFVGLLSLGRRDHVLRTQVGIVLYWGLLITVGSVVGGKALEEGTLASGLANAVPLDVFPLAVVVAILRHRLFDIDRLVSRTVSYLVVVGLLGGVYVGGLYVLQEVVPFTSDVAVAASTLAVVALFNPFRKRMQGLVDRRFDRSRYEAVEVLRGFAGRLRGPMTEGRLATELAEVLDTTMHPEAVGVWLRREQ